MSHNKYLDFFSEIKNIDKKMKNYTNILVCFNGI
jgi:hypothetical protein